MIKVGCVVQGDIRSGTESVLLELQRHFDVVILSTWEEERGKTPSGTYPIIFSKKPTAAGANNRNYQRLSTAAGIRLAEEMGCTHILKWRTDMLPVAMDVHRLVRLTEENPPTETGSRIVTCAFRNLTVVVDEFSSIPDLFAFGRLSMMKMLWGDEGFDFSRQMNFPLGVLEEDLKKASFGFNFDGCYGPETELYLYFRSRMEKLYGRKFHHKEIVMHFFRLIDHQDLKICWLVRGGGYRSIVQAIQHPWWRVENWMRGDALISEVGYPETNFIAKVRRYLLSPFMIWVNKRKMQIWHLKWKRKK